MQIESGKSKKIRICKEEMKEDCCQADHRWKEVNRMEQISAIVALVMGGGFIDQGG